MKKYYYLVSYIISMPESAYVNSSAREMVLDHKITHMQQYEELAKDFYSLFVECAAKVSISGIHLMRVTRIVKKNKPFTPRIPEDKGGIARKI